MIRWSMTVAVLAVALMALTEASASDGQRPGESTGTECSPRESDATKPRKCSKLSDLELATPLSGVPICDNPGLACWWGRNDVKRDPGSALVVVAINGGGYRASAYGMGVMIALDRMKVQATTGESVTVWDEIDAFSTVSGGSMLMYDLLVNGTDPETIGVGELERARSRLDGLVWKRRPAVLAKKVSGKLGASGAQDVLADPGAGPIPAGEPTMPLWIPNATLAASGVRWPITKDNFSAPGEVSDTAAYAAYASSAVPGALSPALAWPPKKSSENVGNSDQREFWLVDGAWSDRLGLLTALELALASWTRDPEKRAVLQVDTRPWSSFRGAQHYHDDKAKDGAPRHKRIVRRTQLIGLGVDQSRFIADKAVYEAVFGPRAPLPLAEAVVEALKQEGMKIEPPLFQALGTVSASAYEADVVRLGADTLLQPNLWDEKIRQAQPSDSRTQQPDLGGETPEKLPPRLLACQQIAARLYSVVALQPTDFSLNGPVFVQEGEVGGAERHVYAYGEEDKNTRSRQAALVAAGFLTVALQQDRIFHATGLGGESVDLAFLNEALPDLNFRSWQVASEWQECVGGEPLDAGGPAGDRPEFSAIENEDDHYTLRLVSNKLDPALHDDWQLPGEGSLPIRRISYRESPEDDEDLYCPVLESDRETLRTDLAAKSDPSTVLAWAKTIRDRNAWCSR